MTGEPAYIIRGNIRDYEEMLTDRRLPAAKRTVVLKLLSELREQLPAAEAAENKDHSNT